MDKEEIRTRRLLNQKILSSDLKTPQAVVAHMGAMQAQEYAMAKWAVGLRAPGLKDSDIEAAFNSGEILRTHILRPTWHFVAPADIRWLIALSAPRVQQQNAGYYRKVGVDEHLFAKANAVLEAKLSGGVQMTRTQLAEEFAAAGIEAKGMALAYLLMNAELCGLICSGARVGKQFTYAWLDDVVPTTAPLAHEEALAMLSERYFASRGPATVHDFANWSGLTLSDARLGARLLDASFAVVTFDGKDYIFRDNGMSLEGLKATTFLMPDYDEYGMSYKDRSALSAGSELVASQSDYSHWLVAEGMIAGTWEKQVKGKHTAAIVKPLVTIASEEVVDAAVQRYCDFWE
ncbi:winged helix DNA-binding domain-containing protein [Culicoidibacter larvae]|uniref:Winged helix DNA-binding domain-containing protein n=1 Tax=Culicoidibacter larvae TaxID=2579976 RepID=A0A5R8QJE4_9FIRM|nr:winged helix DNA-binding domain-containing protein [Culicoidibacter larvae]TLG77377.1 winged helix DNA-binding domain-containing protein [Culicoidibacter larvae]